MTRIRPVGIYTAYHRTCGHVVGVCNSRKAAQQVIDVLPVRIRQGMRIKAGASQEEIRATMAGTRCSTCDIAIAMKEATGASE